MVPRKKCNQNACAVEKTNFWKRLWYPLWYPGKVLVSLSLLVEMESKMSGASYLKHLRDDLIKLCIRTMISHSCNIVLHRIVLHRQSSVKLPEAEVEVQICEEHWLVSKITWLQPFRLLLLGPHSRESIRWLLLLSFCNDWLSGWGCNGSSPNPQGNETVSLPFGSCWHKRRRLNQNCFWIDINEQIFIEHFVII